MYRDPLALELDGLAGPHRQEHLKGLVQRRGPLHRVEHLARKRAELAPSVVAKPDAHDEAPPRELVEGRARRANTHGRRLASGVTNMPRRTRSVACAIAAAMTNESATPVSRFESTWSQR